MEAARLAKLIIAQAQEETRTIPAGQPIYLLGLPDNFARALVFRTHAAQAMGANGVTQPVSGGITIDGITGLKLIGTENGAYIFDYSDPPVIFRPLIRESTVNAVTLNDGVAVIKIDKVKNRIVVRLTKNPLPLILYFDGRQLRKTK
mgnify:CR=1 FL=1